MDFYWQPQGQNKTQGSLCTELRFRQWYQSSHLNLCRKVKLWKCISQNVKLFLKKSSSQLEKTQVKIQVASGLLFFFRKLEQCHFYYFSVWWHSVFVPESSSRLNSSETLTCSCFFSLSLGVLVLPRQTGRGYRYMMDPSWCMAANICFVLRDKLCGSEKTGKDGKEIHIHSLLHSLVSGWLVSKQFF